MSKMTYAIDFGTSNSLLAAGCDGKVFPPVPLDQKAPDPSILRSVLFFPDRQECFYGVDAIHEFVKHDMDGRFIRSIKKFLPMQNFTGTQIGNRTISIEEIISTFLREMRKRANAFFQTDVDRVLLGRPALFSDNTAEDALAESRLKQAAMLAGFRHIEFCPEPIAAANEFRIGLESPKIALVSDFGGGTSDFTVVRIGPNPFRSEDVLSIGGVSLAGDALDGSIMRERLAAHFGSEVTYKAPFGSNVLKMPANLIEKICAPADISLLRERDTIEFFRNVQNWSLGPSDRKRIDQLFALIQEQFGFELFEEIEKTKRSLSQNNEQQFKFSYPGIEISEEIKRSEFDQYASPVFEKIIGALDETVEKANIDPSSIDIVYSTGGTAKVPALQKALKERFGVNKVQENKHFHSIIEGLAQIAATL
jgi:hypothetical chaperone protein